MNEQDRADSLTLEILEAIEERSDVTQRGIAQRSGVALGLAACVTINVYFPAAAAEKAAVAESRRRPLRRTSPGRRAAKSRSPTPSSWSANTKKPDVIWVIIVTIHNDKSPTHPLRQRCALCWLRTATAGSSCAPHLAGRLGLLSLDK